MAMILSGKALALSMHGLSEPLSQLSGAVEMAGDTVKVKMMRRM